MLLAPGIGVLPFLGLMLALGVGAASLAPLVEAQSAPHAALHLGDGDRPSRHRRRLAGMACESAFTKETLVAARPGETRRGRPLSASASIGVEPVAGPNWTAIEATLSASRGGGAPLRPASPQARMFSAPPTETNEAAIATRLDGQLYTVHRQAGRATAAGSCACGGSRSSP